MSASGNDSQKRALEHFLMAGGSVEKKRAEGALLNHGLLRFPPPPHQRKPLCPAGVSLSVRIGGGKSWLDSVFSCATELPHALTSSFPNQMALFL